MALKTRITHTLSRSVGTMLLTALAFGGPAAAAQAQPLSAPIPAAVAESLYIQDVGDVTVGPKFDDNQWQLLLNERDPSSPEDPGTWRHPELTAIEAVDAEMTVPDYGYHGVLAAEPGESVWVISDAQSGVPSLSLSVDSPEAHSSIAEGATISLSGVRGPGSLNVYSQAARFDEPQAIWDSHAAMPQPHWVDLGEETQTNWAFSEPGVYLVQLTVTAELRDGSEFADTQVLRFAVGEAAGEEAIEADWPGPEAESYFRAAQFEEQDQDEDWFDLILWVSLAVLGVVLVAALLTLVLHLKRRRDRMHPTSPAERDYDHIT